VFLDDFVSSGNTFERVNKTMRANYPEPWSWVAAFLWQSTNGSQTRMVEMQGNPIYTICGDVHTSTGKCTGYSTDDPFRKYRKWEVRDVAEIGIREDAAVHAGQCRV
jgi:hypothetical protein